MDQGVAEIGMKVALNAKARKTRGIGLCYGRSSGRRDHFGLQGKVLSTTDTNEFGSQLVRVAWNDGCIDFMSPDWLKKAEWPRGGYTHGKRKDDTDPLGR